MEGIALSKQGNTDERTSAIEAADRADTQRAGAYSQLPALIRQLGLDPVEMMGLAGLPADALDSPEQGFRTEASAPCSRAPPNAPPVRTSDSSSVGCGASPIWASWVNW